LFEIAAIFSVDGAYHRRGDGATSRQTEQVLKNVGALLAAEGFSLADVVEATVFATDMGAFAAVNEV
jgi:2-iminobutanoate/2-iminopropanoate deaminase